jgi:serine/threonine protein kinase
MPRDSVSILQKLLTREPELRLGSGPTDAQEIMSHAFFRNINWEDVYYKRVPAPFMPTVKSRADTSNFDSEFTSVTPVLTPVQSGEFACLSVPGDGFANVCYSSVAGYARRIQRVLVFCRLRLNRSDMFVLGLPFAGTGRGRSFVIPMGDRMPHGRSPNTRSQVYAGLGLQRRGWNIRSVVQVSVEYDMWPQGVMRECCDEGDEVYFGIEKKYLFGLNRCSPCIFVLSIRNYKPSTSHPSTLGFSYRPPAPLGENLLGGLTSHALEVGAVIRRFERGVCRIHP